MKVVCESCGAEAEVADPGEDGWLFETVPEQTIAEFTDPAGNTVAQPYTYQKPVARYFLWLCAQPVHTEDADADGRPDGYLNTVTEELA